MVAFVTEITKCPSHSQAAADAPLHNKPTRIANALRLPRIVRLMVLGVKMDTALAAQDSSRIPHVG